MRAETVEDIDDGGLTYRITPLGWLGPATTSALISKMKQLGENAVVLNEEGELEWARVEKSWTQSP